MRKRSCNTRVVKKTPASAPKFRVIFSGRQQALSPSLPTVKKRSRSLAAQSNHVWYLSAQQIPTANRLGAQSISLNVALSISIRASSTSAEHLATGTTAVRQPLAPRRTFRSSAQPLPHAAFPIERAIAIGLIELRRTLFGS